MLKRLNNGKMLTVQKDKVVNGITLYLTRNDSQLEYDFQPNNIVHEQKDYGEVLYSHFA